MADSAVRCESSVSGVYHTTVKNVFFVLVWQRLRRHGCTRTASSAQPHPHNRHRPAGERRPDALPMRPQEVLDESHQANPTNENTVNTSMKYPICSMQPHESCHPPIEVQTSAFAQGPPSNPWIRANSSGSETATHPRGNFQVLFLKQAAAVLMISNTGGTRKLIISAAAMKPHNRAELYRPEAGRKGRLRSACRRIVRDCRVSTNRISTVWKGCCSSYSWNPFLDIEQRISMIRDGARQRKSRKYECPPLAGGALPMKAGAYSLALE